MYINIKMHPQCRCSKDCFTYYNMMTRKQIWVCAKTEFVVTDQKNWFLHSGDETFFSKNLSAHCDFYVSYSKDSGQITS